MDLSAARLSPAAGRVQPAQLDPDRRPQQGDRSRARRQPARDPGAGRARARRHAWPRARRRGRSRRRRLGPRARAAAQAAHRRGAQIRGRRGLRRDRGRDGHQRGGRPTKRPRGTDPTPEGVPTMTDDLEGALRGAARVLTVAAPPELDSAAAAAGLLDVAYATLDSPVGELLLAVTPRGLVRLAYLDDGIDEPLQDLARRIS